MTQLGKMMQPRPENTGAKTRLPMGATQIITHALRGELHPDAATDRALVMKTLRDLLSHQMDDEGAACIKRVIALAGEM